MPNNEGKKSGLTIPLLFRFFTGMAVALVFMLMGAFLTVSGTLPASAIPAFPVAAGFFGALWCGRGAARMVKAQTLITGLVSGIAYFFAVFLLGAVFYLRWMPSADTVGILSSCLLGGLLGGIFAGSRNKKRNTSKRNIATYDTIRRKKS